MSETKTSEGFQNLKVFKKKYKQLRNKLQMGTQFVCSQRDKWLYWAEEEIQVGTGWFFGVPNFMYGGWRWLREEVYNCTVRLRVVFV
jgi:hypothetical protein